MGSVAIMYSNYWFIKTLAARVEVIREQREFCPWVAISNLQLSHFAIPNGQNDQKNTCWRCWTSTAFREMTYLFLKSWQLLLSLALGGREKRNHTLVSAPWHPPGFFSDDWGKATCTGASFSFLPSVWPQCVREVRQTPRQTHPPRGETLCCQAESWGRCSCNQSNKLLALGANAANAFLGQNLYQVNGEDRQSWAQNLATASSCKIRPRKMQNV